MINRPAKGFVPRPAFLALRTRDAAGHVVARVLEGPLDDHLYEGPLGATAPTHGLPRFREATFRAAYPFGRVDLHDADAGGLKEATFAIKGEGAFSVFKHEGGVHRVQRVPATEAAGRIHTSTATVAVLPEAEDVDIKIDEKDLRIDVFRLGLPPWAYAKLKELAGSRMTASGELVVTARKFRTQEANRQDARARIVELLVRAHERDARRIKTKPSKAARARRVDEKKGRSAIKAGRGKVRVE